MKNQKTYKFREIVDEDELEKFMRLRYETYFNSSMRNFLQINDEKIDIDIYDLHSRHFGLFCEEKPIGFIRVVIHQWSGPKSSKLDWRKNGGYHTLWFTTTTKL